MRDGDDRPDASPVGLPDGALIEPLTRREREILGLLDQGFSAPEIAEQLTLAVSSVKWHIQHLYGKLGVSGKREALTRAQALGLLGGAAGTAATQTPSPANPKHNLPLQVTRFFGREAEISQLKTRLTEHRLVTLTGSGGVGKTRLSLQVAAALLRDFTDGVWFVELAALSDPELIPQQMATSLGLRDEPGQPIIDTLIVYLRERQVLLVLDNCEHLLAACAQLADSLLRACPRVRLLASSREPLGIGGEAVFAVPSLSFPDPEYLPPVDQMTDYVAVSLFLDRARLVLPDYQVAAHNAAALARISQRLDGIPLAIEMAAARLNILNADQLAGRLDDAFRVLTGGSRSALPRQQTLRATIDWSYQLLNEQERRLLTRLSVFAGGCTLEAAEAVCADVHLPPADILDHLASLVAKSLVIADRQSGDEPRYRLLETVRQYAREKLDDAGDGERLHTRHRDYFLLFFETNAPKLASAERLLWIRRLKAERDNARQSLQWSFSDTSDVEAGPRLLIACFYLRGTPIWSWNIEYGAWCQRGVAWCESHNGVSAGLFAHLLSDASWVMIFSDQQLALAWSKKAVEISRHLGSAGRQSLMDSLRTLALRYYEADEHELSQAADAEAQALLEEIGPDNLSAQTTAEAQGETARWQARIANAQGKHQEAKRLLDESLQLLTASDDPFRSFFPLMDLGHTCVQLREYDEARQYFRAAQLLADELEDSWGMIVARNNLAEFELGQGNLEAAIAYCRVSLALAKETHDDYSFAIGLKAVARVRAAQGRASRAARLSGAAQAIWVRRGRKSPQFLSMDVLLPGWTEWPDAAAITADFEAGQAMSVEQAMAYALSEDAA